MKKSPKTILDFESLCALCLIHDYKLYVLFSQKLTTIAESVKEAKESMRQKSLAAGMDEVHQDLLEQPTCLPLGPELEVTGVSVRNCSYFNSNTLPLKINFVGPDAESLPAIFKVNIHSQMICINYITINFLSAEMTCSRIS